MEPLLFNAWHQPFPANIKLGWKRLTVANTLAYFNTAIITALKGFIIDAPGGLIRNSQTRKVKLISDKWPSLLRPSIIDKQIFL